MQHLLRYGNYPRSWKSHDCHWWFTKIPTKNPALEGRHSPRSRITTFDKEGKGERRFEFGDTLPAGFHDLNPFRMPDFDPTFDGELSVGVDASHNAYQEQAVFQRQALELLNQFLDGL